MSDHKDQAADSHPRKSVQNFWWVLRLGFQGFWILSLYFSLSLSHWRNWLPCGNIFFFFVFVISVKEARDLPIKKRNFAYDQKQSLELNISALQKKAYYDVYQSFSAESSAISSVNTKSCLFHTSLIFFQGVLSCKWSGSLIMSCSSIFYSSIDKDEDLKRIEGALWNFWGDSHWLPCRYWCRSPNQRI